MIFFFFSSRRRHTRCYRDWSSDVCSSDLDDAGHVSILIYSDESIVTTCPRTLSSRELRPRAPRRAPDRKSTRLNSSHGSISYAVFCLKKKNNVMAVLLGVAPQPPDEPGAR